MRIAALMLALGLGLVIGAGRVTAQSLPLEVTIVPDRSAYEVGTPLTFTVRVRNPNPTPLTLPLSTVQRYDVALRSPQIEIARLSKSRPPTLTLEQVRLAGGETWSFIDQWLPTTSLLPSAGAAGGAIEQPLSPGVYFLIAEVAAVGTRPVSAPRPVIYGRATALPFDCTPVQPGLSVPLPAALVAGAVEPQFALKGMWRQGPTAGTFEGFSLLPAAINDLQTVNPGDTIVFCLDPGGRVILPGP